MTPAGRVASRAAAAARGGGARAPAVGGGTHLKVGAHSPEGSVRTICGALGGRAGCREAWEAWGLEGRHALALPLHSRAAGR